MWLFVSTFFPDAYEVVKLDFGEFILHPGSLVHAGMNMVPMPKPPPPPPPTSHQNTTKNLVVDITTKRLRSLRSKRDYQRRKTSLLKDQFAAQKRELISVQEDSANKLELMHDEVNFAETEISHLQHTNQQSLLLAQKHRDQADKASQLLACRSERFLVYRAKKEDELRRCRVAATRRIEALQRQHQLELKREDALRYRLERSHVKQIVCLENKIVSLEKSKE